MSSKGIKDQVAIVGMGCTPFGEHWDRSVDDMLIDAATEAYAVGRESTQDEVDAFWFGTLGSGHVRPDAEPAVEDRLQAGDPGGEHVRHRVRGVPQRLLRRGLGGVRPGDGHRGREAEGQRHVGPHRRPCSPDDGTRPELTAPAMFSLLAPAYCREKYGVDRGGDEGRPDPDRLEEPLQRGPQPPGPVPQGGGQGHDLQRPPHRRPARASSTAPGVSDGSAAAILCRAEDAHKYTDKPLYVKGLGLLGRARRPARSTPTTTTRRSTRWSARPRTPTPRPG